MSSHSWEDRNIILMKIFHLSLKAGTFTQRWTYSLVSVSRRTFWALDGGETDQCKYVWEGQLMKFDFSFCLCVKPSTLHLHHNCPHSSSELPDSLPSICPLMFCIPQFLKTLFTHFHFYTESLKPAAHPFQLTVTAQPDTAHREPHHLSFLPLPELCYSSTVAHLQSPPNLLSQLLTDLWASFFLLQPPSSLTSSSWGPKSSDTNWSLPPTSTGSSTLRGHSLFLTLLEIRHHSYVHSAHKTTTPTPPPVPFTDMNLSMNHTNKRNLELLGRTLFTSTPQSTGSSSTLLWLHFSLGSSLRIHWNVISAAWEHLRFLLEELQTVQTYIQINGCCFWQSHWPSEILRKQHLAAGETA